MLAEFRQLGDLRPGCIVTVHRRCGKSNCHCAQAQDPGHGPDVRLTYKLRGKTKTEVLTGTAAVRKAEREIAEFRKFQRLTEAFVEVNQQICQQRPVEPSAGEAGQLPLYSEWRVVDTWGLNDPWIAHNGAITDSYLDRQKPHLIMFHASFSPIVPAIQNQRWPSPREWFSW